MGGKENESPSGKGRGIKMSELAGNREKKIKLFLYIVVAGVAMLPVAYGHIMDRGILGEWIGRICELSMELQGGHFLLFPSEEVIVENGGQLYAMNSNLWFFIPALIYAWSENIVLGWQIYMIFIQVGTLLTSILMFHRLFEGENRAFAGFFGVLLYMTCPYRIYVCYDLASMSQALVWVLLPLYVWAAAGIAEQKDKLKNIGVAALALAGIGYADIMQMLIVIGITALAVIWLRRVLLFVPLAAGCLIACPAVLRLARYLFGNAFEMLGMPLQSIMGNGYVTGEFFSIFVYRDGHPGMGIGVMSALLIGLWLSFVQGQWEQSRKNIFFTAFAILLLICSLKIFPWELVQRLGGWALKMIALIDTPAVFFGLAQLCLCIPGAYAVGQISRQKEKAVAIGLPLMVLVASLVLCIYQCNMLRIS